MKKQDSRSDLAVLGISVTYADCFELERDFGYRSAIRLEDGLREFAGWYREYYRI